MDRRTDGQIDSAAQSHPTGLATAMAAAMVVFLGRVLEWFPLAFFQ